MCTALNLNTNDHYFGRNLDLDRSYEEEVCIVPRNYTLNFRCKDKLTKHFAFIGMATIVENVPLFYDGTNEYGVSAAGLNFPDNAYYPPTKKDKDNITSFEFIPWILAKCKSVNEAKTLLNNINICNIPFSDKLPVSPLHWIISDRCSSIVVESMSDGLHIYDDFAGVLTNNPPLPYQLFNLNNYRNLKTDNGKNTLDENMPLYTYCSGLGSMGLPGDVSSMSRFVRITFKKANSVCKGDELSSVSQFFHLLSSVEVSRGSCITDNDTLNITVYSSCVNTDKGRYYYTTYDNRQINCVDMHCTDLEGNKVSRFPLILQQNINYQN